ncbi:hypothetical protein [Hymenobacter sp. BT491]|uniref:hypothetical protein n=1 Tax=Hymenobacter sp. BT491 TaxID=2766779 RepID=UPI001653AADC|nr:hypothetical protein [Hymenobacter sp. BT491]
MEPPKPQMVQIIENRSRVTGIVQDIQEQTELPDFVRLTVQVATVQPVTGFADLLSRQSPATAEVLARRSSLPTGLPGKRVEMTVRMAPMAKLFLQDDSILFLDAPIR